MSDEVPEQGALEMTEEEAQAVFVIVERLRGAVLGQHTSGLRVARACMALAVGIVKASGGSINLCGALLVDAWNTTDAGKRNDA